MIMLSKKPKATNGMPLVIAILISCRVVGAGGSDAGITGVVATMALGRASAVLSANASAIATLHMTAMIVIAFHYKPMHLLLSSSVS